MLYRFTSLDSYDPDDGNSSASEVARTPAPLSEGGGDSFKDPASVPMADMMSPPSVSSMGMRTPTGKPPKKKSVQTGSQKSAIICLRKPVPPKLFLGGLTK